MFEPIKQIVLNFLWPIGNITRIIRGPLKGYKFVISKNSGWSPILGRWEPQSQQLFTKVVEPETVIYDLGANNGIHSLLFSKLTGNNGKVYSFEPLASNCNEIERNAKLNSINNIHIVKAAVSNQSGETTFHLGLHDKQGSLVGIGRESGHNVAVTMITLDEFIQQGNPPPDFIKIDIEGAEAMALKGFEKTINDILPTLFIELHTPEQDKLVGEFLLNHHYMAFRLKDKFYSKDLNINNLEPIRDLTKPYPNPTGIWGTILAVHESKVSKPQQSLI